MLGVISPLCAMGHGPGSRLSGERVRQDFPEKFIGTDFKLAPCCGPAGCSLMLAQVIRLWDRYDWTTGVPDNGHSFRKGKTAARIKFWAGYFKTMKNWSKGPQMGGQIRRGRIWRGRPDFQSRGPQIPIFTRVLGLLDGKSGRPKKRQIQPRRI